MTRSHATSNVPEVLDCRSPAEAVGVLAAKLTPLGTERLGLDEARGRVLATSLDADRDSPALDVSAMDGFAVRRSDLTGLPIPIAAVAGIGVAPVRHQPGTATRIVTGAPIPIGADAVIRVEDTRERGDAVEFLIDRGTVSEGQFIRRRGDNIRGGEALIERGSVVTSSVMGALATFGHTAVEVHRRVRVRILTTGDEVVPADAAPAAWQVRNAHAPALAALLGSRPWIEVTGHTHLRDDPEAIRAEIRHSCDAADAIVLTGGVSMGEKDFVLGVIAGLGGRIVFHRVPQRPGRPMLGALIDGKPVLGLPGNPLSVLVTARRLAVPIFARLAGVDDAGLPVPLRAVAEADQATIGLWWHRLVAEGPDGRLRLVPPSSSGDSVAGARSAGFVEVPPGKRCEGPWPYYAWDF